MGQYGVQNSTGCIQPFWLLICVDSSMLKTFITCDVSSICPAYTSLCYEWFFYIFKIWKCQHYSWRTRLNDPASIKNFFLNLPVLNKGAGNVRPLNRNGLLEPCKLYDVTLILNVLSLGSLFKTNSELLNDVLYKIILFTSSNISTWKYCWMPPSFPGIHATWIELAVELYAVQLRTELGISAAIIWYKHGPLCPIAFCAIHEIVPNCCAVSTL